MRGALACCLLVASLPLAAAGFPNPFTIRPWDIRLPGGETPANVEVHESIEYGDSSRKLDLYIPRGKDHFPVVLFVHGGAWRVGDRSLYRGLGNRLARAGVGVAIPSFRQMGVVANRHPAQIEDVAAAFAWLKDHVGEYGGDANRLYAAGHSSGGHLVSLLALDAQYLARHGVETSAIRGVISISGVYSVDRLPGFHAEGEKRAASPLHHVHAGAPRFLVAYCQWDFAGLPRQARQFAGALRKASLEVEVLRIPRDNHISEILNITKEQGPLVDAVLKFVQ